MKNRWNILVTAQGALIVDGMFSDVDGDRVEAVVPAAERDCYREALETIAGNYCEGGDEPFSGMIACDALEEWS